MVQREHLEAFGDEEVDDAESDFASEHQITTVDPGITAGRDEGETETPRGWDGMDTDSTP
jgi:hypothetical protein